MYVINAKSVASTVTGGFDVAEEYPTSDSTLEAGDVVAIDISKPGYIVKSSTAYDSKTIGIVSTDPGITLGDEKDGIWRKVALSGRIPVKVSTVNGPIQVGDDLTSSSIPGVAMKATNGGAIIGKALEPYTAQDAHLIGSISAFAKLSWSGSDVQPAQSSLTPVNTVAMLFRNASDSTSAFTIQTANGSDLLVADTKNMTITVANLIVTGTLTVNGHIVTGGNAPTIAANDALCTNVTDTIAGNDESGVITLSTSGSGCIKGSKLVTVTFNKPYDTAPRVTLTAGNAGSAALQTFVNSDTISTTSFELDMLPTILNANTTYKWYYQIVQ